MDSQNDVQYYANLLRDGAVSSEQFDTSGMYAQSPNECDTISQLHQQNSYTSTKKAQRGVNFTNDEDILLCSAWLNVSLDPVQGNQQKLSKYWDRIHEYFHENKTTNYDRNANSLMNRWNGIKTEVSLFCGFYAQIEASNPSGKTIEDKIVEAKMTYDRVQPKPFQYLHCWKELKNNPKWASNVSQKKRKFVKKGSPGQSSSASEFVNLEDDEVANELERPIGRKAAKEKLKNRKDKERVSEITPATLMLEKYLEEIKKKGEKTEQFQQKYLQIETEKLQLRQRKEDQAIMDVDTSAMDPITAEYYNDLKQEILVKRRNRNINL